MTAVVAELDKIAMDGQVVFCSRGWYSNTSRSCDKLVKLNYVSLYQDVWTCSSITYHCIKTYGLVRV